MNIGIQGEQVINRLGITVERQYIGRNVDGEVWQNATTRQVTLDEGEGQFQPVPLTPGKALIKANTQPGYTVYAEVSLDDAWRYCHETGIDPAHVIP